MNWLKSLWNTLKSDGIDIAINALDNLEDLLTERIEKYKKELDAKTSREQAIWIIDQVQDLLRNKIGRKKPE